MKLHILSDIHLEFGDFDVDPPERDVLLLAGDIAEGSRPLQFMQREYHKDAVPILFTSGNHEYYHQDMVDLDYHYWQNEDVVPFTYLQCEIKEINGVTFAGCTLWTDFWNDEQVRHDAKFNIADFFLIRRGGERFTPEDAVKLNQAHVNWLRQTEPDVVMTHFPPVKECIVPKFAGDSLNPYFVNNLSWLVEEIKPSVWHFGHTHACMDFMIGDTRVISNARGYHGREQTGFDPYLTIEV